MPCKPGCRCNCGKLGCECWDGITPERIINSPRPTIVNDPP